MVHERWVEVLPLTRTEPRGGGAAIRVQERFPIGDGRGYGYGARHEWMPCSTRRCERPTARRLRCVPGSGLRRRSSCSCATTVDCSVANGRRSCATGNPNWSPLAARWCSSAPVHRPWRRTSRSSTRLRTRCSAILRARRSRRQACGARRGRRCTGGSCGTRGGRCATASGKRACRAIRGSRVVFSCSIRGGRSCIARSTARVAILSTSMPWWRRSARARVRRSWRSWRAFVRWSPTLGPCRTGHGCWPCSSPPSA